jgi:hypothetical protein
MSSERALTSAAYRLLPDDLDGYGGHHQEEGALQAQCSTRMALSPVHEREVRRLWRIYDALSADARHRLFAEIGMHAERGTAQR